MTSWNQIADPAKQAIKAITPVDGETTNDYVEVIDLVSRWLTDTVITIANTAAVNELTYKVEVFNDYANGTAFETQTNTAAVSDSDQVILVRHARVKVSVKATSSGNQTNYKVDVIAGRG